MPRPAIIGCIIAWGTELFIEPAIRQALEYCDEVNVCIEPHSPAMVKYKDSTLNIVQKYSKYVKIIALQDTSKFDVHAIAKAQILNSMKGYSKYNEKGNWIWILDVDEFYDSNSYSNIINIISNSDIDILNFKSKYFYIDTKHYLISEHPRLFKIVNPNEDHFIPTQNWSRPNSLVGTIPVELGIFHYGTMTNPHAKMDFWKTEYPGKTQDNKVTWIDKIYRNYELNNEEKWITENEKLFGLKSPWFSDSFLPDDDRKLFIYNEKHPTLVEDAGLTKINDYRTIYNFKRSEDE